MSKCEDFLRNLDDKVSTYYAGGRKIKIITEPLKLGEPRIMYTKEQIQQELDELKLKYGEWNFDIPLPFGIWTKGNLGDTPDKT